MLRRLVSCATLFAALVSTPVSSQTPSGSELDGIIDGGTQPAPERPVDTLEAAGADKRLLVGADLIRLQQALSTLGYDVGRADGRLSARLRRVLASFQQARGLPADGIPDARILARVLKEAESADRAAPAAAETNAVLALGQQLGIPVVDGHLVYRSRSLIRDVQEEYEAMQRLAAAWYRLNDRVFLGAEPSLAESDDALIRLGATFGYKTGLNSYDLQFLQPGGDPHFEDEFARRAYVDGVRREVLPRIAGRGPGFPIPVLVVGKGSLGSYDFDRAGFPISYRGAVADFDTMSSVLSSRTELLLAGADAGPDFMPMKEAAARNVSRSPGGTSRPVFVTYALTIDGMDHIDRDAYDPGRGDHVLRARLEGMSVYADPDLTQLLHRYSLGDLAKPAVSLSPDAQLVQSIDPATSEDLVKAAYDVTGDAAILDVALRVPEYRSADEFSRAEVAEQLRARLLANPRQDSYWITGLARVGEYDGKGFPIDELQFKYKSDPRALRLDGSIRLAIANASGVVRIDAEREAARAARSNLKAAFVPIALRVKPVRAEFDGRGTTPGVRLWVDAVELVAWYEGNSGRSGGETVFSRMSIEAAPAPQAVTDAAQLPPVPMEDGLMMLSQETLDLLRVKRAPDTMASADYMRMLVDRWRLERTSGGGNPGFFSADAAAMPNAIERERLLPSFVAWTKARADRITDDVEFYLFPQMNSHRCLSDVTAFFPLSAGRETFRDLAEKGTPFDPGILRNTELKIAEPEIVGPVYAEPHNVYRSPIRCMPPVDGERQSELAKIAGDPAKSDLVVRLDGLGLIPDAVTRASDGRPLMRVRGRIAAVTQSSRKDGGRNVIVDMEVNRTTHIAFDPDAPDLAHLLGATVADIEHASLRVKSEQRQAERSANSYDITGVRLGMSFAEAEAVISGNMAIGRRFELRRQSATTLEGVRPYSSAKILVRDDGAEMIFLYDEPPAAPETVVAVSRMLFLDPGAIGGGDVLAGLRQKYGAEAQLDPDQNQDTFRSYWLAGAKAGTKPQSDPCYNFVYSIEDSLEGVWFENGTTNPNPWYSDGKGTPLAFPQRAPFQTGLKLLPPLFKPDAETMAKFNDCAPMVEAEFRRSKFDSVSTLLLDPTAYAKLFAESLRQISMGWSAAGQNPASPAVDLKL